MSRGYHFRVIAGETALKVGVDVRLRIGEGQVPEEPVTQGVDVRLQGIGDVAVKPDAEILCNILVQIKDPDPNLIPELLFDDLLDLRESDRGEPQIGKRHVDQ